MDNNSRQWRQEQQNKRQEKIVNMEGEDRENVFRMKGVVY